MQHQTHFSIVVRVSDLDKARSFYQNVLELGAPVLDSNFWVEFALSDQTSLALEKAPVPDEREAHPRVLWTFRVKSLKKFVARFAEFGYDPGEEKWSESLGAHLREFHDPAGTPFSVTDADRI